MRIDNNTLDALFTPAGIAVIGASSDPSAIGGRPIQYLKAAGYAGALYPVNPKRAELQGLLAYPDCDALPGPIDLAIITVAASDVPDAVAQAAAAGARAAVIFSAGFAETGNIAGQAALHDLARLHGIRVLGPNCLGLYAARSRTVATFASCFLEGGLTEGPVAIVSQSGAYGSYLMLLAAERGIGVGTWVTTGNEMDVGIADLVAHCARDPALRVIGCIAEGIGDGAGFLRALEAARDAGKPVVVMKMGRTSGGAAAAQSHTASLAVDDAVFDAVVRQAGAYRVTTTQAMLDLLGALEIGQPLTGARLGIVTISGGVGVLMSDAASDAGLIVPPLPAATQAKLDAANPLGASANPVDVTGQATKNPALVEHALAAVLDGVCVDAGVAFLMNWLLSPALGPGLTAAIDKALAAAKIPLALVGTMPAELAERWRAAGVLIFDDPDRAIATLGAMAQLGAIQRPRSPVTDLGDVPLIEGPVADEATAKALLTRIGLRSPTERIAATPEEAGAVATAIGGRIALKILSADLPHKSDIGGVVLGLAPDDVEAAARAMLVTVADHRPDARLDGFLVGEMIGDGIEMIVGCHIDPTFGPLVMVGFGGTLVEVLRDVAFRYGAIDATEARAMIAELAGAKLLDGVRGAPPADISALAETIAALSRFGAANAGRIAGVEINPLLVRSDGKGCVMLDALIPRLPSVLSTPAGVFRQRHAGLPSGLQRSVRAQRSAFARPMPPPRSSRPSGT